MAMLQEPSMTALMRRWLSAVGHHGGMTFRFLCVGAEGEKKIIIG
jgi:hypothetical protein